MGFKLVTPTEGYIKSYYKELEWPLGEYDALEESDKTFVQDGEKGPILGPLKAIFIQYYKRAILKSMRKY